MRPPGRSRGLLRRGGRTPIRPVPHRGVVSWGHRCTRAAPEAGGWSLEANRLLGNSPRIRPLAVAKGDTEAMKVAPNRITRGCNGPRPRSARIAADEPQGR